MRKHILNKRGLTLMQLFITIVIMLVLLGVSAGMIVKATKKQEETEIRTNVTQTETASKSYHTVNGRYPALLGKSIVDNLDEHAIYNFSIAVIEGLFGYDQNSGSWFPDHEKPATADLTKYYNSGGKHYDRTVFESDGTMKPGIKEMIDERFTYVDYESLRGEGTLTEKIKKDDFYMLDNLTGKVYYVDEDAASIYGDSAGDNGGIGYSNKYLRELIENIKKSSANFTDLRYIGDIASNPDFKAIGLTNIMSSAAQGQYFIIGGRGDDAKGRLALVILSTTENAVNSTVQDFTPTIFILSVFIFPY